VLSRICLVRLPIVLGKQDNRFPEEEREMRNGQRIASTFLQYATVLINIEIEKW
jgi:hypothetical protein